MRRLTSMKHGRPTRDSSSLLPCAMSSSFPMWTGTWVDNQSREAEGIAIPRGQQCCVTATVGCVTWIGCSRQSRSRSARYQYYASARFAPAQSFRLRGGPALSARIYRSWRKKACTSWANKTPCLPTPITTNSSWQFIMNDHCIRGYLQKHISIEFKYTATSL